MPIAHSLCADGEQFRAHFIHVPVFEQKKVNLTLVIDLTLVNNCAKSIGKMCSRFDDLIKADAVHATKDTKSISEMSAASHILISIFPNISY